MTTLMKWCLGILSIPVFLVLAYVVLSHSNTDKFSRRYCFDQERYLFNEELEELAISAILKQLAEAPPSWHPSGDPDYYQYASVEGFKTINPDCCDPIRIYPEKSGQKPRREAPYFDQYILELDPLDSMHASYRFRILKSDPSAKSSVSFSASPCGDVYGIGFYQ